MRYGLGRQPKLEMSAANVLAILHLLAEGHIDAWLDGGWAVDAVRIVPDPYRAPREAYPVRIL